MEGIEQITTVWGTLEAADRAATLWLNGALDADWLAPFWSFMSQIKVWFPMYALVAALLIWRLGWKKGLVAVAAIALAFFFDERINNLIKAIAERPRPCNDDGMLAAGINVIQQGWGFSFPSGHANNSMGFALGSFLCLRMDKKLDWTWYGVFIFVWAALVCVSRIAVACHFLGDVLAGAFLGAVMAFLWVWVARKVCKKIK